MGAKPYPDDVYRADHVNMTGQRYGWLVVLGYEGRVTYKGGQRYPRIRVRCDCGTEFLVDARHVRNQGVKSCKPCSAVISGYRASRMLPTGKNFVDLALESGLKLNTIYQRWLRGWPLEDLTKPAQERGQCRVPRRGASSTSRMRDTKSR